MSKLLIVEDEINLGMLYSGEFQKEGYEVILARDGIEAIRMTKDHDPDIVVMDIRLPKMNGINVMKQILKIKKNLPIIINTSYSSFMDDFNSWAAKAYVIKSGDMSFLKKKVAEFAASDI